MKQFKKILIIALLPLLVSLSFCTDAKDLTLENADVTLQVRQSGKSDCIYIDLQGYRILIDCADEDDFPLIDAMLKARGANKLDLLILTHFDNDHIGSAADVINSYPVDLLVMPCYIRHSKPMRNLLEAIEDNPEMKVLKLNKQDYEKDLGEGISVFIDAPKADYGVDDSSNSLISVITLDNGERLLFTGDATKERLGEFFSVNHDSFVFAKMPHHGGYNTEVKRLLTEKDLAYAAITIGSPDDAEVKMLTLAKKTPVKTLYTCDGDIFLLYKDGNFRYYQVDN